ncbi:MAG TPA: cyclic nucleotide-binding domain-containing protein [Myxococcales bacterium]|nr:cyclic nucleotide-binding domain-containing protein [Myxococcales bacterium]
MEKLAVLSRSPLFEMLSNQELEYVADLSRPRKFTAGQVVFEEGELGDSLYVIVSGEVEVLRRDASGDQQLLTRLGPPEFFGEMSLIDKEYRSATVRARVDSELLQLTAENLTTFRKQHRDGFTFVVINIARVLSARLREANAKPAAG